MQSPISATVLVGFCALCGFVGWLFVAGVARANRALGEEAAVVRRRTTHARLGAGVLMAATVGAAEAGLLEWGTLPPRVMLLVTAVIAINLRLSLTAFGERLARGLSWSALVGFQAFRVPVEIFLWRAHGEGVIPRAMTFEGFNFDIVTGVAALALGLFALRGDPPRWLLLAWNIGGLLLLINIVSIAALSMPTPLRVFTDGPANTFVATAPFIWLPIVLVQAALMGHVLVFRKLAQEARDDVASAA